MKRPPLSYSLTDRHPVIRQLFLYMGIVCLIAAAVLLLIGSTIALFTP